MSVSNRVGIRGTAAVRMSIAKNIAIPVSIPEGIIYLPGFRLKKSIANSASTTKNIEDKSASMAFVDRRSSVDNVRTNTETDISSELNRHLRIA